MRRWLFATALLLATLAPGVASAQTATWLDTPLAAWNVAGAPLPRVPTGAAIYPADPRCGRDVPPPATAAERAVAAAGWHIYGRGTVGRLETVHAASGYDGMCRPMGYHVFVFADGAFAGTVSPVPLDSRLDGALSGQPEALGDGLRARFHRYRSSDPLCCPTGGTVAVDFRLDRVAAGPVLVPIARAVVMAPSEPSRPPATVSAPTQLPRTGGDPAPFLALGSTLLSIGALVRWRFPWRRS